MAHSPKAPRSATARSAAASADRKLTCEVSVMAWIEDATGQVLMVRQATGKRLWTLPGGKVKPGETLQAGLRRELLEETGERVRSAHPIAIFDRSEKRNLTILFRVSITQRRAGPRNDAEIENVAFKPRLPKNASPSASYFWKLHDRAGMA